MTVVERDRGYDTCGAQTRQPGGRGCARPAGWGTDHVGVGRCKLHGGMTPTQRAGAALVLEERRARSMIVRLGAPREIDHPVFELIKLASETVEWQSILRERLGDLGTLSTTDTLGVERERAIVVLYERALDRSAKILTEMAKLDLAAKAMKLNQAAAGDVVEAVVLALRRCGLGEHETRVRTELALVLDERRQA